MDKSWIQLRNRSDARYMDGIREFVMFATQHGQGSNRYKCPCRKCINSTFVDGNVMAQHLYKHGMMWGYTTWSEHGEVVDYSSIPSFTSGYGYQGDSSYGRGESSRNPGMDLLDDLFPGVNYRAAPQYETVVSPTPQFFPDTTEIDRYNSMLVQAQTPVYEGCPQNVLQAIMTEMKYKVKHKISDAGFNEIQQHICELLPRNHNLPDSHYNVKKILSRLGLKYKKIHACRNDCVLFYQEYEDLEWCPVCSRSRWRDGNRNRTNKKIPVKVLRYFPLIPRLQRLYMSSHTAEAMRWYAEKRVNDDVLRHVADGEAFQHFDREFPSFAAEVRNVRLGLSTDGFNPWGNQSAAVSTWPVILMPYNLPPWMCMNKEFNFLTLLIPGPNSPGKCLDVYLRPLIDELKLLWENGAPTYDKFTNTQFVMRAALMWTISDFPAYGMLASCRTKGFKGCPVCLDDVNSSWHAGKTCYMGHRRWLPPDHPWRQNANDFDGSVENDPKPRHWSGEEIFDRVRCFDFGVLTNDDVFKKLNPQPPDHLQYWHHISIFFQLPYWSMLKLRHNLDVMHIEKNVCDSVVGTILGIKFKNKDTPKARRDLEAMNLRRHLWLKKDRNGVCTKMPDAPYTVKPSMRTPVFRWFKSVRFPSNYAANIFRCVKVTEHKFIGLKTHDCHVMLQRLIPVVVRPYLPKDVVEPVVALCRWWQRICARELKKSDVVELQDEIIFILCKFERIFPPALFDIMVHLMVHLPEQVLLSGPVHYTWMYPQERQLGEYKGFVKNKSSPDGSIAETYLMHECVTYCSRYLNDPVVEVGNTIVRANLSVVTDLVRPFRGVIMERLTEAELVEAHWVVLRDCEEIEPYMKAHRSSIKSFNPGKSDEAVENLLKKKFPDYFLKWMNALHKNQDNEGWWSWEKHMLAMKPVDHNIYPGCFVNGVKFNSVERDEGRRTQNSGICVGEGDDVYYGELVRVIQLLYGNNINVFLFKCKWFRRTNEDLGLISVDTHSSWYENEPFALATFVRQVFYVDDPKAGEGWKVVNHMSHRGIWPAVPSSLVDIVSAYQEADTTSIPTTTNLISFGERLPMPDQQTDLSEQDITALYGNVNDGEEADDDDVDDVVFDDDDEEYDDEDHWSSDNAEVNVDDVNDDDSD